MDRRNFLKVAGGAAISLAGFGGCARRQFSSDPSLPNIVLITADDLGWRDLGCYGNSQIKTPNIDRLANEGIKFTNNFVVASSCSPSRASIITGQYPHTNGVDGLAHRYKLKQLKPFYTTLPSLLEKKGYNTAIAGKWHVAPYLPTSFYGYGERLSGFMPKDMWIKNMETTLEFIRQNRDNRFYLEVNYMNNHRDDSGEFQFDPEFPVDPNAIKVPDYMTLPNWPEIRLDLAKDYSQTMKMDKMIGQVLDELDKQGLKENTIVAFVSDNGPPYPGNKMTCYDRGTGTPLIIRWSAKIKAGSEYSEIVSTIDIMPTMLEAAGVNVPATVQGKSLLGVLEGRVTKPVHDAVYSEMTYHVFYLPTRSVRTRQWKYIRNYSDIAKGLDQCSHMDWAHRLCELPNQPWKKPRVKEELYDLAADPHEQNNLAADPAYAKQLETMRKMLDNNMAKTGDEYLNKPFTQDYDPKIYEKTS